MAIDNIIQPEIIQVDNTLRLRKYNGIHDFAFIWYQNPETVYLVDGVLTPYSSETLDRMYSYLDKKGELYFIEILENGVYKPIGDVTFWQEDMPIVIGNPNYRGMGIGRKVISALIQRGRELGYSCLYVNEIYDFNTASRKCFESAGFTVYEKTDKGHRFICRLE